MIRYHLPLGIFLLIVVLFVIGLRLDPRHVPSPLIDKPAPEFSLPSLRDENTRVGTSDFIGKVTLLNVWASWCVSCLYEHPLLMDLFRQGVVPIYGLNYKDERKAAIAWLEQRGDPYQASAYDEAGRVGIDYGVYGVPETYVLDKKGIIRHKHIGPLTREDLDETILPLIRQLNESQK
ncbi:MAG: DsbE family thiol:disulfide interchange protein [Gammaproteobacteria bacterium]|nr:DsbE family thiol:disulfide interchange protein [Gammaproteobacteria bacterium]NIQ11858.1 DsbE family thiol:disulfide interchange protein [Gammaproteobacteria bacterium]NIQ74430.1 DsbE family thiol:disulfide interchange protein [Gammaproteobacteria bacterium]NIR26429.1 DsbE family thiol:disulfide interchange protein [Gammaproteobacteria bacterium]NIR95598.1 DsbE family thiol:disulfide interchange protein [Gammaproteobacteria bacterium]